MCDYCALERILERAQADLYSVHSRLRGGASTKVLARRVARPPFTQDTPAGR